MSSKAQIAKMSNKGNKFCTAAKFKIFVNFCNSVIRGVYSREMHTGSHNKKTALMLTAAYLLAKK